MNYYAVTRSGQTLKHYGVKGMKWGVRKAIYYNNEKALERHYRKAAKKLRKLEDIGNRPGKYAAKATAYGAAAVGTGTLAVGGKHVFNQLFMRKSTQESPFVNPLSGIRKVKKSNANLGNPFSVSIPYHDTPHVHGSFDSLPNIGSSVYYDNSNVPTYTKYARIGAGVVAAGLAAKSAQNAYRAKNAAKYRRKAHEFRNAMNETFSGTKYAGLNGMPLPPKKRRKKSK